MTSTLILKLFSHKFLGYMALIPIYIGSHLSTSTKDMEKEKLSTKDASRFPVIASIVLGSLYICHRVLPKDIFNILVTTYFAVFSLLFIHRLVCPPARSIIHWMVRYDKEKKNRINSLFSPISFELRHQEKIINSGSVDIVDGFIGPINVIFMAVYAYSKNWIMSNILAECLAISTISTFHLDHFATGIVLLTGLFVYDIFWVFGTNVMVTVALNLDIPAKVVIPRNLGLSGDLSPMMLGLGDIIIPGAFIAFCLQFDHGKAGKPKTGNYPKPYFMTGFISYVVGLIAAFLAMNLSGTAQPALLYLSPACIVPVTILSVIRKEFLLLWNFSYESAVDPGESKSKGQSEEHPTNRPIKNE